MLRIKIEYHFLKVSLEHTRLVHPFKDQIINLHQKAVIIFIW